MTYEPEKRKTRELLADWAAVMRVLRERDIIRTNNNPISDIAEAIVTKHYGGTRGSFSQAGWDVRVGDERMQVKSMRLTPITKRKNFSPIRGSNYDTVVAVVFDQHLAVVEGLRIPRAVVEEFFEVNSHVNGRIIRLTKQLRAHPLVIGIDLTAASHHLDG